MDPAKSIIIPSIKGLVLAGGESKRMGFDKGLIDYHGMPQREYLQKLLIPFTVASYISCKPGQIISGELPILEDSYADLGPFGGILSAFKIDPSSAWLVVACDFPFLGQNDIQQLMKERDTGKAATCFLDPRSQLPEPWITILEPSIYPVLLDYLQKNKTSLRGILIDQQVKTILPNNAELLLNANTPDEAIRLKKRLDNL